MKITHNKLTEMFTFGDDVQVFVVIDLIDTVFIMRENIENPFEYNRPAFLWFTPRRLEKASDRVLHEYVLDILDNRKVPMDIVKLNRNTYYDNTVKIKGNIKLSDKTHVEIGIRQSDFLIPLLFNLKTNHIIKKINTTRGY